MAIAEYVISVTFAQPHTHTFAQLSKSLEFFLLNFVLFGRVSFFQGIIHPSVQSVNIEQPRKNVQTLSRKKQKENMKIKKKLFQQTISFYFLFHFKTCIV